MTQHTDTATDSVDTGALVIDGPQPVWMTLNHAREQAFTGEVVFEGDPEVLAYLDNGIVYYAERAGDAPLGQRLLDAGVIDATQLERGIVRIGDLEHLGRLFDRDTSINRDAVIVTAELFTEELISELANRMITNVRIAAYRHHPSGVHRWFVAPVDQTVAPRPIGAIGQLDVALVGDLPGLPYNLDDDDEFMIEWDDFVDAGLELDTDVELDIDDLADSDGLPIGAAEAPDTVTPEQFDADALELSLELAEFVDHGDAQIDPPSAELVDVEIELDDGEIATETATEPVDELIELEDEETVVPDLDVAVDAVTADEITVEELTVDAVTVEEFTVDEITVEDAAVEEVTVEEAAVDAVTVDEITDDDDAEDDDELEFAVVWPDGSEQPAVAASVDVDELVEVAPAFTETDDGELQFSMPPLELSDEPDVAGAEVPDDVADAVRRAIAAIESASVGDEIDETYVDVTEIDVTEIDVTEIDVTEIDVTEIADADADMAGPNAGSQSDGLAGFAPPTMATRAEVLYGQMTDDGALLDESPPAVVPTLAEQPAPGRTSSDDGDDGDDRTSALRRLIGSLRRKDH